MNPRVAVIALLIAAPLCAQVPQATALYEQARFEEAKRLLERVSRPNRTAPTSNIGSVWRTAR